MPDAMPPPRTSVFSIARRVAVPQVLRGMLMGAADVVPGVSGGTLALAVGIYLPLIEAINRCVDVAAAALRLNLGDLRATLRRVPWLWLGCLGVGMGAAVFSLSGLIQHALAAWPQAMAGLFMGLIMGTTVLAHRMVIRHTPGTRALLAASAVTFFFFLGLNPAVHAGAGVLLPPWWAFMGAGAIAICAMILPGISGSFLLVLMGMYAPVLEAVSALRLTVLLPFALGCTLGLALASRGLNWLLRHHHDLLLACMTGLMLGSLRVLWPWPHGLNSTALALPAPADALLPVALGALGFALAMGVDALARRMAASAR